MIIQLSSQKTKMLAMLDSHVLMYNKLKCVTSAYTNLLVGNCWVNIVCTFSFSDIKVIVTTTLPQTSHDHYSDIFLSH